MGPHLTFAAPAQSDESAVTPTTGPNGAWCGERCGERVKWCLFSCFPSPALLHNNFEPRLPVQKTGFSSSHPPHPEPWLTSSSSQCRDPAAFESVLQYLRTGALPSTAENLDRILVEADYFCLQGLKEAVANADAKLWSTGRVVHETTFEEHSHYVLCLQLIGDYVISGSSDATIQVAYRQTDELEYPSPNRWRLVANRHFLVHRRLRADFVSADVNHQLKVH